MLGAERNNPLEKHPYFAPARFQSMGEGGTAANVSRVRRPHRRKHDPLLDNGAPCHPSSTRPISPSLKPSVKKFGPRIQGSGGKLTVTALLLKILSEALKTFPEIQFLSGFGQRGEIYFQKTLSYRCCGRYRPRSAGAGDKKYRPRKILNSWRSS